MTSFFMVDTGLSDGNLVNPLTRCRVGFAGHNVSDGHGIVTDGFDLEIRGDAQFPCTVLLIWYCLSVTVTNTLGTTKRR